MPCFANLYRKCCDSSACCRMQQIRGTHGVAPCYPSPRFFARVIRGPSRSEVAGIRTLGFTTVKPRGNSIPFRDVAEEVPLSSNGSEGVRRGGRRKDSHFYPLSYTGAPRIHTTPVIYYRVMRELGGGRAVPRVLFHSVLFLTV